MSVKLWYNAPGVNLASQLQAHLPPPLWELLLRAGQIAQARGWPLYLVGGIMRDLLLGKPSQDLDLVVEGDAPSIARELSPEAVTHPRFGTAKVRFEQWSLDLASARQEEYPHPGALPQVRPGDIHHDLGRRDFTINAMAVNLSPTSLGQLLDPFGGKRDLEQGLIRILHPKSFTDDATRIFRALRYEQRFDFKLEENTKKLLIQDISQLNTISGDRLRHEIELIFKEKIPEKVLDRAGELGVLHQLSPGLKGDGWLSQRLAQARGASPTLSFCLLFYPLPLQEGERLIARLNFPKTTGRILSQTLALKEELLRLANLLPVLPTSQLYFLLQDYSPTAIQANVLATPSPLASQGLELYLRHLRYVKLSLSGDDLINLGVPQGPLVGTALERLIVARLDGVVNSRQEEIELVIQWLTTKALEY